MAEVLSTAAQGDKGLENLVRLGVHPKDAPALINKPPAEFERFFTRKPTALDDVERELDNWHKPGAGKKRAGEKNLDQKDD